MTAYMLHCDIPLPNNLSRSAYLPMYKDTNPSPYPAFPGGPYRRRYPPARVESARLRVGRAYMHYLAAGDGPPLVLIHGYSASSNWWRNNIAGLAAGRRVYALDLAGFGRSWPKHTFSLRSAVDGIVAWADAMGFEKADFCGHSMGGHICIRLAEAYPARVDRLVLTDASGLPFNARLPELAWRGLRGSGHTGFRFAPTVVGSSLQAGPFVLYGALRDLLADDVEAALGRVAAPTLIVWGERDVLIPLAHGLRLHQAIPGSQLVVIPGAGHNVMLERPAEYNRVVLDFLK